MNFRPLALLLGVAALSSLAARDAATPRIPERRVQGNLTLEHALSIALKQNPEILKAIHEIERTRGQVIEIRSEALPHISSTANYSKQDQNLLQSGSSRQTSSSNSNSSPNADFDAVEEGLGLTEGTLENIFGGTQQTQSTPKSTVNSPNDQSWQVTFEVRQVLYAGGQIRAAINIAKFTEDSSYWNLRDTIDRIISRVRTQFASVLLNRALITVQEESIQLLTNQLKDQQNRFEAGTVPRFNVLRAEVELSNARPELIRARNNYLIAQLELARSLGLEPGPDGKPAFYCVGQLSVPVRNFNLNDALRLAKERRPFLKVQRQNILIETEQIKVALAGYQPRLEANAGYLFRNDSSSDDLGEVVNGWFFGVSGRWEIFDGLRTYGKTKQAEARLQSAKVNYDDSVLQVELEVQQAYALLQQARETIQSQLKGVEQAQESLRLATERLAAGAGTQLDVLDARVALTSAQTTELQARADYSTALAEFDRATATDTVYHDSFRDPLSQKSPLLKSSSKSAPKPTPQPAPKSAPKSSPKSVQKPRAS